MNKFWPISFLMISICGCAVNPSERNNAGNALYIQGNYDSALLAYWAAQVASPDSPDAYYNAASAYSQKGEYDKAIEALQQALKTANPELRTKSFYNLGNMYFQLSRFDDAVDAYQQTLLLDPNDEDARHNLELAIKRLVVPSPTPISATDQPADVTGSGATPTSELPSQLTGNPPSTADLVTHTPDSLTVTPSANDLPATISVDDAEKILDAVQQAQQALPNSPSSNTPPADNINKDW